MPTESEQAKIERIDQAVAMVHEKVDAAERATLEAFVGRCYGQADPDDVAERSAADLYGGALSLWNLARRRIPGEPRIRVLNPSAAEHGWHCAHTVVEIVNDDMPFLVDSATMEVNRQGLALHWIFHPIVRVTRVPEGSDGERMLTGLVLDDATDEPRE